MLDFHSVSGSWVLLLACIWALSFSLQGKRDAFQFGAIVTGIWALCTTVYFLVHQ